MVCIRWWLDGGIGGDGGICLHLYLLYTDHSCHRRLTIPRCALTPYADYTKTAADKLHCRTSAKVPCQCGYSAKTSVSSFRSFIFSSTRCFRSSIVWSVISTGTPEQSQAGSRISTVSGSLYSTDSRSQMVQAVQNAS